jgi:hypothetical protein
LGLSLGRFGGGFGRLDGDVPSPPLTSLPLSTTRDTVNVQSRMSVMSLSSVHCSDGTISASSICSRQRSLNGIVGDKESGVEGRAARSSAYRKVGELRLNTENAQAQAVRQRHLNQLSIEHGLANEPVPSARQSVNASAGMVTTHHT